MGCVQFRLSESRSVAFWSAGFPRDRFVPRRCDEVRPGRQISSRQLASAVPCRAQRAQRHSAHSARDFFPAARWVRAAGKGGCRAPSLCPPGAGLRRSLSERQGGPRWPRRATCSPFRPLRMKAKREHRSRYAGGRSSSSTRRRCSVAAATSCSPCASLAKGTHNPARRTIGLECSHLRRTATASARAEPSASPSGSNIRSAGRRRGWSGGRRPWPNSRPCRRSTRPSATRCPSRWPIPDDRTPQGDL